MGKQRSVFNQQGVSKQSTDYILHFSVGKDKVGNSVKYFSNLEITLISESTESSMRKHDDIHIISKKRDFNYYVGGARLLSRKQVHLNMHDSIPSHHYASMPSSRVVSVNFVINNGVATMEHYLRESETPFSKEFCLETLIMVADDLKEMGCNSVLTQVFIPGKNSSAGKDKPVLINIDKWIDYLHVYKSPSEFAKQSPL